MPPTLGGSSLLWSPLFLEARSLQMPVGHSFFSSIGHLSCYSSFKVGSSLSWNGTWLVAICLVFCSGVLVQVSSSRIRLFSAWYMWSSGCKCWAVWRKYYSGSGWLDLILLRVKSWRVVDFHDLSLDDVLLGYVLNLLMCLSQHFHVCIGSGRWSWSHCGRKEWSLLCSHRSSRRVYLNYPEYYLVQDFRLSLL